MDLYHQNNCHKTKFYVIDVPDVPQYKVPPVLGLQSCENIELITINAVSSQINSVPPTKPINGIESLKSAVPHSFDTIGNFKGEITLHLKEDAEPYIAAPRKCSVHMRDRIKDEFEKMEDQGIIRKVDEYTNWCSNVCFVTKKDGSLRVCLDPQN